MKHSLYIAAIMLLVLILSQGYWLYNIYNAEKYKTQEVLRASGEPPTAYGRYETSKKCPSEWLATNRKTPTTPKES